MVRRLVAVAGLVALVFGIWVLWPRGESETTPSTSIVAAPSTTIAISSPPTTSPPPETTTTANQVTDVVETVEEAEEILRELWFGWFEGIYNQDEDRIKEVVGSQTALDNAREQFGVMDFSEPPNAKSITFADTEILRSDAECLVIYSTVRVSGFREGSSTTVNVARPADGRWVSIALWEQKGDAWESDCQSSLESLS